MNKLYINLKQYDMKTFYIISYETGRSSGTVKAVNYDKAFNICLNNNINVYDTYFLEDINAQTI